MPEEGAHVSVVGRDDLRIGDVVRELTLDHPGEITGVVAELSTEKGRDELADAISQAAVLVNNAGAIPGRGLDLPDASEWRQAWELKVYGYIELTKIALRHIKQLQAGVVVNVIGAAGVAPRDDYIFGAIADASLIAVTKAAGAESIKSGVVGINPGPTETDRLRSLYMSLAKDRFGDEGRWHEMLGYLPFGRPALVKEMADLVVYLSSARASYLSGVVVDADGGARYSS